MIVDARDATLALAIIALLFIWVAFGRDFLTARRRSQQAKLAREWPQALEAEKNETASDFGEADEVPEFAETSAGGR